MRARVLPSALAVLAFACTIAPAQVPRDAGQDAGMRDDSALVRPDVGVDASTIDAAAIDAASSDAATHDASSIDAYALDAAAHDAGTDAVSIDAGGHDAFAQDAGTDASDAPSLVPPVIDGVIGATEWSAATTATSTTATIWTGDTLSALHAIALGGTLYLAIEGQVESFNGMVLYLDGDPGGANGIADLSTLTDSIGALDNVISAGFTTPTGHGWDLAWGTTAMSHSVMGADDTTGFRDIVHTPDNFGWIVASTAQTACSATACEASIPTAMLPGAAPRTIAMFARIANSDGTMSPNQTLPMDDPTMPRLVMVLTTISEM
jgi:hypothetical protein